MKLETVKPRLLLAACCGPCATVAFVHLRKNYDVTTHFWGNNFDTEEEYNKRLEALQTVNAKLNERKQIITEPYLPHSFTATAETLKHTLEGGERCKICYDQRLRSAATAAKAHAFDAFATTLTVSPHKNSNIINDIGNRISNELGINYVSTDLKKDNGFSESVALSKQLGIYRQNYCGCTYSKRKH